MNMEFKGLIPALQGRTHRSHQLGPCMSMSNAPLRSTFIPYLRIGSLVVGAGGKSVEDHRPATTPLCGKTNRPSRSAGIQEDLCAAGRQAVPGGWRARRRDRDDAGRPRRIFRLLTLAARGAPMVLFNSTPGRSRIEWNKVAGGFTATVGPEFEGEYPSRHGTVRKKRCGDEGGRSRLRSRRSLPTATYKALIRDLEISPASGVCRCST